MPSIRKARKPEDTKITPVCDDGLVYKGRPGRPPYARLTGRKLSKVEEGGFLRRSATNAAVDTLGRTMKPGEVRFLIEGGGWFSNQRYKLLFFKSWEGEVFQVVNFKEHYTHWKIFLAWKEGGLY